MKRFVLIVLAFAACGIAVGQDIQSGLWYADGRSIGMGGAMSAIDNRCLDLEELHGDSTNVQTYVNASLPYGLSELAIFSAGAVLDWKQFSWWLHGGWSGTDEQFASLLFGHTLCNVIRYVAGVAVYRLNGGSIGGDHAVLAFMAEAGLFYRPLESLQFGVWFGNPTLTRIDSVCLATDFHLGMVYDVSERLQFVLELERQLQQSLFAHVGLETAIYRPLSGKWRVDGRFGVRYPSTEVSMGLGVAHNGRVGLRMDAATVCDWKLGWSFASSMGVTF